MAASIFNVCEKTVRNWMKLYEETGAVEPRAHRGGRKSSRQRGQVLFGAFSCLITGKRVRLS
ncbi:MAG: helix-turn-helix domain-containing protein [Mariprofundaceae bacterium]|nr:helix-turn-helix domain-containing protein [Mariprofundaceae bacterium]